MVLMAIDHVRVYAAVPAGGPDPAVFFTRWITHFCAPGFVFFAGASAYLHRATLAGLGALSRFLLIRGLWLVVLELTLMRFAWTFNFDVINYNLAGVLWMIGWSMVALAGLIWLPFQAIAALGLAIIAGHNLIDPYVRDLGRSLADDPLRWLYQFLYFGGSVQLGESGPRIAILYSLVPWIGVMAAGYAFGKVLELPEERRHRVCLAIGAGCIALFIAVADVQPLRRSAALVAATTAVVPEHREVSGITAVPVDDARAVDPVAAGLRSRAAAPSPARSRPSGGCRCSITCCTSR